MNQIARRMVLISAVIFVVVSVALLNDAVGRETSGGANLAAGLYSLYVLGNDNNAVGHMTITAWGADTFLIRGTDWVGMGKIEGSQGYYDWKFDANSPFRDLRGMTGRTTFTINPDGTLKGHVVGSGLDWWYLARKENL